MGNGTTPFGSLVGIALATTLFIICASTAVAEGGPLCPTCGIVPAGIPLPGIAGPWKLEPCCGMAFGILPGKFPPNPEGGICC